MLSTNKPLMEKVFANMLTKDGVFYNAAYNAYYKSIEYSYEKGIGDVASIDNTAMGAEPINTEVNKEEWEKMSAVFANSFIQGLKDGKFDTILANEIDKHVKSASIAINVPALPPTLTTSSGPVTGSLIISESMGAKIIIS